MHRLRTLTALGAVFVLAVVACGDDTDEPGNTGSGDCRVRHPEGRVALVGERDGSPEVAASGAAKLACIASTCSRPCELQVPQVLVKIVYRLALPAPAFFFGLLDSGPLAVTPVMGPSYGHDPSAHAADTTQSRVWV